MIQNLTPNQTYDPTRGSFLVRPRKIRERKDGSAVFIAPTERVKGRSEEYETYSNAIQFHPVYFGEER